MHPHPPKLLRPPAIVDLLVKQLGHGHVVKLHARPVTPLANEPNVFN
jgi:hypothetical protein